MNIVLRIEIPKKKFMQVNRAAAAAGMTPERYIAEAAAHAAADGLQLRRHRDHARRAVRAK